MQADEEGMAWETYLQTHPNTVFRKQITERMDELGEATFQGPRGASRDVVVDKGKQELDFSAGMLLEPIDPRSRFRVGFEWGPVADQPDRELRAADRSRLLCPRWNGPSVHWLESRGWSPLRDH